MCFGLGLVMGRLYPSPMSSPNLLLGICPGASLCDQPALIAQLWGDLLPLHEPALERLATGGNGAAVALVDFVVRQSRWLGLLGVVDAPPLVQ